jgi:hypothetical protein
MRAFGGGDDAAPAASDEEDAPRRVVSLKKSRGSADDAPRKRARDGDDVANGDESGEARKKGVRGRGAATFQSSVVAAVDDGPRRDPPEAGPTRVLKVRRNFLQPCLARACDAAHPAVLAGPCVAQMGVAGMR